MRNSIRVGLLAGVAALALALAGSALAAFSPKLFVSNLASGVQIKVTGSATDDAAAKVTVYAPLGYALKDPPPAGTVLGAITAQAQVADLGGAIAPLTGSLVAADPAQYTGLPNNPCVPGVHAQVWLLNLSAAGQPLSVPAYVDPTSGPEATFSSLKIQVCLPPADLPAGTPGRAPLGAKLINAEFATSAVIPAAAGGVWHSIWTPYTPAKGTANVAGTVEAQAKATAAVTLSLSGRKSAKKAALLTAKVSPASAGVTVTFFAGGKKVTSKKTDAKGVATLAARLVKATSFTATVSTADSDLGAAGCTTTVPGSPFPCIDTGVKGVKAAAKAVRVKP